MDRVAGEPRTNQRLLSSGRCLAIFMGRCHVVFLRRFGSFSGAAESNSIHTTHPVRSLYQGIFPHAGVARETFDSAGPTASLPGRRPFGFPATGCASACRRACVAEAVSWTLLGLKDRRATTFNLPALPPGRNSKSHKINLIPNRKIGSHEPRRI